MVDQFPGDLPQEEPEVKRKGKRPTHDEAIPPAETILVEQTPLEKLVQAFFADYDVTARERKLMAELAAVGITSVSDLEASHNLGNIRQALMATFRADAHVLLSLAVQYHDEV